MGTLKFLTLRKKIYQQCFRVYLMLNCEQQLTKNLLYSTAEKLWFFEIIFYPIFKLLYVICQIYFYYSCCVRSADSFFKIKFWFSGSYFSIKKDVEGVVAPKFLEKISTFSTKKGKKEDLLKKRKMLRNIYVLTLKCDWPFKIRTCGNHTRRF